MRKILFTSLVVLATFSSCSESNDDRYQADTDKLYGVWVLEKSTFNGQEIESQDIVEFSRAASAKFTHIEAGIDGDDVIDSGDFSIVASTIIINWNNNINGNSVTKYQILELSDTKLKWKVVMPNVGNHIETFTR